MDLKKALETALDFEKKGHDIYEGISLRTKNPILSKTFRYLSNQELYHIQEIKEYVERLETGFEVELKGDTLNETKEFFTMTVNEFREKTELSDDDIKAHETALMLEKKSYDFYKAEMEKTNDKKARKFFEYIMNQEKVHYEFIEKSYGFIKDPAVFYSGEENWILEG